MPGTQTIILKDQSAEVPRVIEIKTRPTSLWRLVPGLGPLVMFRLGASASFRMDFKLSSEDVEDREQDGSLSLGLLIKGKVLDRKQVSFPYPQRGRSTLVCTEGFFLDGLGHSQLQIQSDATSYVFDIWEPAYAIVNWGMVLLAGGLGGLIGFLLASL